MSTTPTLAMEVLRAPRAPRPSALVLTSVIVIAAFALAAVFAPFLAPYDPDAVDFSAIYSSPTWAHPLGTDGLGRDTLFRVSEIIEQECGAGITVAVLSGPSFAVELARELPTAVSIASRDAAAVERVQAEFRAPYFRLYGTDDVVGVEIGGALKNVIAIAAGAAPYICSNCVRSGVTFSGITTLSG